jgi:hypothetical protein
MALSLLLSVLPLPAQTLVDAEYRAKANYLVNFPNFVEWPQEAWPPGKGSFLVCVLGQFSFGTVLAEMTRGTRFHDRRLEARWIEKPQELASCQILFISRSEKQRYHQALDVVRSKMVLTVGETPEFLDAGGIVCFSMHGTTLQFDVNLDEANKAHLKFSSKLLALARRVVNTAENAKS